MDFSPMDFSPAPQAASGVPSSPHPTFQGFPAAAAGMFGGPPAGAAPQVTPRRPAATPGHQGRTALRPKRQVGRTPASGRTPAPTRPAPAPGGIFDHLRSENWPPSGFPAPSSFGGLSGEGAPAGVRAPDPFHPQPTNSQGNKKSPGGHRRPRPESHSGGQWAELHVLLMDVRAAPCFLLLGFIFVVWPPGKPCMFFLSLMFVLFCSSVNLST